MNITIRRALAGDEGLILSFIRELATYEKLSHEVVATEEHLGRTLFCDAPKAFALIAEEDGEPVGFALYFFNYSTFLGKHGLYLEDLYVRESARGLKAGEFLLAGMIDRARELGAQKLYLLTNSKCAPAIHLYEKLGFEHDRGILDAYAARYERCDVAMLYKGA